MFDLSEIFQAGEDEMRWVKSRVNQSVFRDIVLTNYETKCCITGINNPELLIAGHILPWSASSKNRLNPRNGLALNALHDKAFESGLITITEDYKIKVSSVLLKTDVKSARQNFLQYEGAMINLPKKFAPDPEFLRIHNQTKFKD